MAAGGLGVTNSPSSGVPSARRRLTAARSVKTPIIRDETVTGDNVVLGEKASFLLREE